MLPVGSQIVEICSLNLKVTSIDVSPMKRKTPCLSLSTSIGSSTKNGQPNGFSMVAEGDT